MAWRTEASRHLGEKLSSLSSGQSTSTHYRPSGPVCACDTPFRSHQRRHSGPSATVTEQSIPTHSGRQVHPMPEAIPLVDAQTTTCAKALALHRTARFGVPAELTSDRGSQFTSELWATLSQLNGTRLHRTTAYHPQSNGIVERFYRHLKSALMARLTGADWIDKLPWVLLGIRTVPKEDLGCSSPEMVYGASLTVPGYFLPRGQDTDDVAHFLPRLRETVRKLAPRPTVPHGTKPSSVPTALADSRFVFVRRDSPRPPLTPPYEAPTRCWCTAISRLC